MPNSTLGAPDLSSDGLELYFNGTDSQSALLSEIYVAKRTAIGEAFAPPVVVVSSSYHDQVPAISPDGLELYFTRVIPSPFSVYFWRVTRASTDSAWSAPQQLAFEGFDASFTPDGLTMYFMTPQHRLQRVTRASVAAGWGVPEDVSISGNLAQSAYVSDDELSVLLGLPGSEDPPIESSILLAQRESPANGFDTLTKIDVVPSGYRAASPSFRHRRARDLLLGCSDRVDRFIHALGLPLRVARAVLVARDEAGVEDSET